MTALKLTKENFEQEVLRSDRTTLVDFWAPWCGPCKAVGPIVDQVAAETADRYKVGKVNVEEQRMLAMQYQVMSIPTMLIVRDGKVVNRFVGARSKEELLRLLQEADRGEGKAAAAGL